MTSQPRGAAAVGYVNDLGPVETAAVRYLRMWSDGPASQAIVWNDFKSALGPEDGRITLKSFEQLCSLCQRYGRRPLARHHTNCRMLGADESCFANFVALAADGEQEDAMLISTLLVRADFAPCVAALAAEVGLAFKRMYLCESRRTPQHFEIPEYLH
ncbi:MAG: hypothetical protein ACU0CA_12035 [Paracoccaceae bacterium]